MTQNGIIPYRRNSNQPTPTQKKGYFCHTDPLWLWKVWSRPKQTQTPLTHAAFMQKFYARLMSIQRVIRNRNIPVHVSILYKCIYWIDKGTFGVLHTICMQCILILLHWIDRKCVIWSCLSFSVDEMTCNWIWDFGHMTQACRVSAGDRLFQAPVTH